MSDFVVTPGFIVNNVLPSSQTTALAGWPMISGRCNTVSITVSDVTAGVQFPLITTLYRYPFHVDEH